MTLKENYRTEFIMFLTKIKNLKKEIQETNNNWLEFQNSCLEKGLSTKEMDKIIKEIRKK